MYDSIVWSRDDVEKENYLFSRYCNSPNNGRYSVCDNTNLIINKDFIETEIEIEKIKRALKKLESEEDIYCNVMERKRKEMKYLSYLENNVFSGFVGNYFGNTVIKMDGGVLLLIETVEDDYHYFIPIDVTNTDVFDVDMYLEIEDFDGSYYDVMKNSSKVPSFKVKIEDMEEVLVPIGEELTEKEINAFNNYKTQYVQSFLYIQENKLSTFSLKRCGKKEEKGSTLVKKYKDNRSKKKI